jgi:hypothetical protein
MLNPMSLAGEGVVAIWNGIRPEGRAEFFEWHSREHMPERVGIPGFLRGRRYIALEAHPEFFTLYETQTTAVLTGADYLARLNSPTPWTRTATAAFTDTSRSLCRVALSLGPGEGGLMMTWRLDNPPKNDLQSVLARVVESKGVCGMHYCIADREGSGIQTEEKKGRPAVGVPAFVVMIEGGGDRAQLEAACSEIVFDQPVERGLYQLQYAVR